MGTAWEEYTADGRTTQTITTIEGNSIIKVILKTLSPIITFSIFNATMVKVQTPDAATGYHTTREEREFSEDGTTMTLRFQSIFKRIIKDG